MPDDVRGCAIGVRDCRDRRRIDRCAGAGEAADRAGAAMLAMLAAGLIARLASGGSAVVADFGRVADGAITEVAAGESLRVAGSAS